jgi:glycosyltransferase involved in cell wall biosynthesis
MTEVLVVNNDRRTPQYARYDLRQTDFAGRPERLRLVICPFKGLSFARNAAISEARGTLLCYLDDDAIAFPDWLEQLWKAYEQYPDAGVIGGTVLLHPPEPRPRWAKPEWELYWSAFAPNYSQAKKVEQWGEFPFGANWSATQRRCFALAVFARTMDGVEFWRRKRLLLPACFSAWAMLLFALSESLSPAGC